MSDRAKAIVLDFIERAGWTAGQQFFVVLLAIPAAGSVVNLPWKTALVMSAGAAIVSLLTTGVQYLAKMTDLTFWPDLGVRLAKTFLASILGTIGADAFDLFAFNWHRALDIAALATLSALAKGLLARTGSATEGDGRGDATGRPTPSTLPNSQYLRAIR